jgi:hypothetical protein
VIRLRSEQWQLAGGGVACLGLVATIVAIRRLGDARNVVDLFFAALGIVILGAGIALAASSVTLEPGRVVVANGWRRHRVAIEDVVGVAIEGLGDRRGAGPGELPPRATWVLRIDTTTGSLLCFGLMANRKPRQRDQLLSKAQVVARHCGVARGTA